MTQVKEKLDGNLKETDDISRVLLGNRKYLNMFLNKKEPRVIIQERYMRQKKKFVFSPRSVRVKKIKISNLRT